MYHPECWHYESWTQETMRPFGDETTYRLGLGWLYEICTYVEDWGAGMAYGRRFVPDGKAYFAVDGAESSAPFVDQVADLHEFIGPRIPEGIFMRHVLEHDEDWRHLLERAAKAFTRRMCLVIFTPFSSGETRRLRTIDDPFLDLSFNTSDLIREFSCNGIYRWGVQGVDTNTQYGKEHVFKLEKGSTT